LVDDPDTAVAAAAALGVVGKKRILVEEEGGMGI